MEVRFLCCNLAVGTLDSQDSALEHQRTTDTRTTCLQLGKSVGKILYLERLWIVEAFEYGHWMRFREDFVFSRCTRVDRVKSCISFACALKGLPSGQQALT